MEIRYIKENEAADFQKVSAASFIWKFNAEEDNTVKSPVLAAFENGRLIAGVEIFEFRTHYCGNFLNTIIASGVCSLPECRRMGGVRQIFNKIAEEAIKNDWILGFLHPFSIAYYEKFGYATVNRMSLISVPFEKLRHIPYNTDVELYDGSQFDEIRELHEKCALKENLMTLREDRNHFCDKPLEETNYTYIHRDKNGKADGYVNFMVNRPTEVAVEDMLVLTPDALLGIIGFLRNYDGIAKTLLVRKQYPGSPFACLCDSIDEVSYSQDGVSAGRIYNLQKLLEANSYPEKHGRFSLKCCDDIEQNNAIFEVEYENGTATVKRRTDGDYDICLSASAAAKLMLAGEGHTAKTAVYIKGVEINGNADDFFRAFPHRPTRFTDSPWTA